MALLPHDDGNINRADGEGEDDDDDDGSEASNDSFMRYPVLPLRPLFVC